MPSAKDGTTSKISSSDNKRNKKTKSVITFGKMRNMENSARSGFVLTDQLAFEIYKCKLDLLTPRTFKSSLENRNERTRGQSPLVGKAFGVSAKTIRDIWNRRTWATATSCLWELERRANLSDDWRRSANECLQPSSQVMTAFFLSVDCLDAYAFVVLPSDISK